MRRKTAFVIAALVFLVYSNALFNHFVGDDHLLIEKNSFYTSWSNFPRLFGEGYIFDWGRDMFAGHDYGAGSVSYRPADNATYFMDFQVWGLRPFGYHLTNVLIHVLNVVMVYFLFESFGVLFPAAAFGALLFGLHPVQSEAVCNIGYRADVLACFFVLCAMHAWLRFTRAGGGKGFYWLSLLSYFLAVFTKESAAVFPLALLVYEQLFGVGRRIYQSGFWLVTLFYAYVYCFVFFNSALPHNHLLGDTWFAHMMLMGRIWAEYVRALLVPFSVYPVPSLYAPAAGGAWQNIMPFIVLAGILSVVFIYGRRSRALLFLSAWFFIFYIPVSNLIPLANPMAHRFLYLPSIGFLGALAIVLNGLFSSEILKKASVRLKRILQVSVLALCAAMTVLLNASWNNDYLIASWWVKHYPRSWKAYEVLGLLHFQKQDYGPASGLLLKSLEYGGRDSDVRIDYYLGMCYLAMKQYDRAYRHLNFALTVFPDFPYACHGMGRLFNEKGDYGQALKYYLKAVDLYPGAAFYYIEPVTLYLKLGQKDKARELLDRAGQYVSKEEMQKLSSLYPAGR